MIKHQIDISEPYEIVNPPRGDSNALANQGKRIMLFHRPRLGVMELHVAPKGELWSGWVIGLIK